MIGPFISIKEIAKHFSVSISTIRAWVRQGYIPKNTYIKVGNTYRFSITDVCNALANTGSSDTKEPDSATPDIDIVIKIDPTWTPSNGNDEDL